MYTFVIFVACLLINVCNTPKNADRDLQETADAESTTEGDNDREASAVRYNNGSPFNVYIERFRLHIIFFKIVLTWEPL